MGCQYRPQSAPIVTARLRPPCEEAAVLSFAMPISTDVVTVTGAATPTDDNSALISGVSVSCDNAHTVREHDDDDDDDDVPWRTLRSGAVVACAPRLFLTSRVAPDQRRRGASRRQVDVIYCVRSRVAHLSCRRPTSDVTESLECRPKSELHFRCSGSVLPAVPLTVPWPAGHCT